VSENHQQTREAFDEIDGVISPKVKDGRSSRGEGRLSRHDASMRKNIQEEKRTRRNYSERVFLSSLLLKKSASNALYNYLV
jgi:hypothetical protein